MDKLPRFVTEIARQQIMIDGIVYTASDCRNRIVGEFRERYGENSFRFSLAQFLAEWFDGNSTLRVYTSGSTGEPKELWVEKRRMMNSALMTVGFLGLNRGDTALLCMPLRYIAGKMVVVRSLVAGLNLIPIEPCGHPLAETETDLAFAAMIPLQVFNSLQVPFECERLKRIRHLIIGGGAIDSKVAERLETFPNAVWSTYGMTETLSHIALRRLNGAEKSEWYTPFDNVEVKKSEDDTLIIRAPLVNSECLVTNDVVEFDGAGRFRVIGRKDNIINTGGVKVQIEKVEAVLRDYLPFGFQVTSAPDVKFGDHIVLLVENTVPDETLMQHAFHALPPYWRPKQVITVEHLPQTETGKPDRATAKRIAATHRG